jgi:hypothetical protein
MKKISVMHFGGIGDTVWSLPTVLALLKRNNCDKADYYLKLNNPADFYNGHPLVDITMSYAWTIALKPLLESQSYIDKVAPWSGETIDYDLTSFHSLFFNVLNVQITTMHLAAFNLEWDCTKPWLTGIGTDDRFKGKVIINRTQRARMLGLSYNCFKDVPNTVFVGVPYEHELFMKEAGFELPGFSAPDFLSLACWLNSARVVVGSQSFCQAIAESMGINRILEYYSFAPNGMSFTPNGIVARSQADMTKAAESLK